MIEANTLVVAFLSGVLPAIFWLWFWLKEDGHPEPKWILVLTFVSGMLATLAVIPVEKSALLILGEGPMLLFVWALTEEAFKFLAAKFAALKRKEDDEPIDPVIYMITSALGFAALENALFILNPLLNEGFVGALLAGNMRFIGATLLHTLTSGIVGIFIGMAFYKTKAVKKAYFYGGFLLAVLLHTLFNFFIINNKGEGLIAVFAAVWLFIIILLLLFEVIKRIRKQTI